MTKLSPSPVRLLSFFLTACMFFTACSDQNSSIHRRSQFLMGTLVEISVHEKDKEIAQASVQKAFHEIRRLEKLMSIHIPNSEISIINDNAGKSPIPVSQEVIEVIQRSLFWSERTAGAFDITIGPVQELWDFDKPSPPTDLAISDAIKKVNFRKIQLDGHSVFLTEKDMKLNLGAIAKGYAVDKAIQILKKNKIKNALINAGGDLKTIGKNPDNALWKIGLQHPRKSESLLATFSLLEKAVATSGDYQKYFKMNGKRFHHILDPKTGYPATRSISATVITNNVMDADALATALFVMGPEKGIGFLDSLNETEGLIVDNNGKMIFSKNLDSIESFTIKTEDFSH